MALLAPRLTLPVCFYDTFHSSLWIDVGFAGETGLLPLSELLIRLEIQHPEGIGCKICLRGLENLLQGGCGFVASSTEPMGIHGHPRRFYSSTGVEDNDTAQIYIYNMEVNQNLLLSVNAPVYRCQ